MAFTAKLEQECLAKSIAMTDKTISSSDYYWQNKYHKLAAELEQHIEDDALKQEQLRRGLVMTSLLAEGQTASLDIQLQQLRKSLKPGNIDLSDSLVDLESIIGDFESQNIIHFEVLLSLISDTANRLSRCPLPKPLLNKVKGTRKNAKHELQRWAGYREQLQSWLSIIAEIAASGDEKTQQSGWWQRWFKSPQPEASLDDLSSVETTEEQIVDLVRNVSETIQNLLDKLVIPERLVPLKESLKERLEEFLEWDELIPILDETADFLLQCIETSQVKIEEFLQSLDLRLQAIRALVTEASNGTSDRAKARQELDTLVRQQLSDVRSVVSGRVDLTTLGSSVSNHLELILRAMEHYRDEEEIREKRFNEHIEQLQERLTDMTHELQANQQSLEDQKRKATTDALTGLPNREAYQQRINEELARFQRYGSPLSLVMCDIDYFKKINDSYGHLAGDKVLQLIARSLQKNIRDTDFIARFGGEEFVILMPETNIEEALAAANKLREFIAESPFNFRKERVFITMSIGIAEFQENETPNNAFERADLALYKAKSSGRNQWYWLTFKRPPSKVILLLSPLTTLALPV